MIQQLINSESFGMARGLDFGSREVSSAIVNG